MLDLAMWWRGVGYVLVASVMMSLCEGAKTKLGVDYELSEEFEVEVEMA